MVAGVMPFLRALLSVSVLALVVACASPAVPVVAPSPHDVFEDAAFKTPSQPPDPAAVFALSAAMQRYLEHDIAPLLRRHGAQRGFVEALKTTTPLRLDYDAEVTRTAAEAFDARAGNCLSLVVMTAALAKRLDLPITYQALVGQPLWSRIATDTGRLVVANGHVNLIVAKRLIDRVATLETAPQILIEFGGLPLGRGQALQPIAEATVMAMFMNNRAAEFLVRGELDNAYAHAKQAVLHDATYATGYNTLGVIYQRQQLLVAAERAYRAALARDDGERSALMNLQKLFESQARWAEAEPLKMRLAQLEKEPPFEHFDRGVAAVRAGDYATGREALLREMKRDPDYHEFHYWLAVAMHGLGDVNKARSHLTAAMKNSLTTREHALYAAKLRGLDPATSAVN